MSQTLTLQLSDEAFAGLQVHATAAKVSPSDMAAASLERQFRLPARLPSEAEQQAARERFLRHFGEVDLGHPM